VIPKEFDYVAPNTVQEALAALRDGGDDAKVLAGGHSLIPLMKLRLAAPSRLVDLRNIADLQGLRRGPDSQVIIGSMVTYTGLQNMEALKAFPLLGECAAAIGDAQVRARGTIGGSLAHADPASDLPAAALALDAVLIAAHLNGSVTEREIPARDFFTDLLTTALEPGEILTGIRLPTTQGRAAGAYVKIRNKASHYALAGAAVMLRMGDDGTCSNASIALTGVASKPFRLERAEGILRGSKLEESAIREAANAATSADVEWMSDLFGSEEYRKHLAGVVTTRAIESARSRVR
jgi:carbon-monoxide dehydrogenase medium subunit